MIVLGSSRCVVSFARDGSRFFAEESCGKCFPCRIGATRAMERLEQLTQLRGTDESELDDLAVVLSTGSACGLGSAAGHLLTCLADHFAAVVAEHAEGRCQAGVCQGA